MILQISTPLHAEELGQGTGASGLMLSSEPGEPVLRQTLGAVDPPPKRTLGLI